MIIGHQLILDFFKKSIDKKRLSHAYLFTGPACVGKRTAAMEFIRMLVGSQADDSIHPDISIIEPEITEKDGVRKESEIGIKQARKIQHQMSLFPYQADYKVALIDGADKMTIEAFNCLLKTLEEPSGKAILILTASNLKKILPTIVSRCQIIRFLPVDSKEIEDGLSKLKAGFSKESLNQIIRLSNGRPGLAIKYLENPELLEEQNEIIRHLERLIRSGLNERYQYAEEIAKNSPMARQILNYWLFWFRDLILLSVGCSDLIINPEINSYKDSYSLPKLRKIIKSIRNTDFLLSNPSINARLALEVLMLEF